MEKLQTPKPEFYGDLVYKLKKEFIKIIPLYKKDWV